MYFLSRAPSCSVEVACPRYLGLRLEYVRRNTSHIYHPPPDITYIIRPLTSLISSAP